MTFSFEWELSRYKHDLHNNGNRHVRDVTYLCPQPKLTICWQINGQLLLLAINEAAIAEQNIEGLSRCPLGVDGSGYRLR